MPVNSTVPQTPFLDRTLLEASDPSNAEIFKNMQGNILKGHGRDHATMIFIRVNGNKPDAARAALHDFTENHVTNFYTQLWERERYKRNQVPGDTFGAVFITSKGYEFLEKKKKKPLGDEAFEKGMKARVGILNDAVKNIESWHNAEIHAMLLLADDDKTKMDKLAIFLLKNWKDIFTIVHIEYGDAIRNSNGDGLEHNGYVDGVSQPLFLKDEVDAYIANNHIKNNGFAFDPTAKPGLVLVQDPYAPKESYGSYFVFRKLEQHVKAFKNQEAAIGEAIYEDEENTERSGARIVGRFEDGTPIQIQGDDKLIGSGTINNFNYDDMETDPSGGFCPHFAHIRKVNPRKNKKFDEHAIARRGIPFGHRNISTELEDIQPEQYPEKGVGLLFMCYQKSIVNQFEFIQKAANTNDNNTTIKDGGLDPVIGQGTRGKYLFPDDGETKKPVPNLSYAFDQHVHFKGGEYFFAPSMTYLKSL